MPEVGAGIEAGPVLAPLFNLLQQRIALTLVLFVAPVHLVGDDDRRDADLQIGGKFVQIFIRQHHATVAGARRTAIRAAGCAVQPDAAAGALVLAVPFVRIAERVGSAAIHIGKLALRQFGLDEIHADGGALVAFGKFFGAEFADGDVKVGDIARFTIHIFINEQRGAAGVHHQRIFLPRIQLPQEARYELDVRSGQNALQAHPRFVAQVLDLVARRMRRAAEVVDRAGAGHQHVAFDQVRQLEIGVDAQQAVHFVERDIEAAVLDGLQAFCQMRFAVVRGFGIAQVRRGMHHACQQAA